MADLLLPGEKVYEMASPDWWVVTYDQAPLAVVGLLVSFVAASMVGPFAALLLLIVLLAMLAWRYWTRGTPATCSPTSGSCEPRGSSIATWSSSRGARSPT
ncbi:MAG: hypothetical protein M5U19_21905 [Microthrixaceae bacterium]|nr:hypothetical protein [Microthrixaceae bacterium]